MRSLNQRRLEVIPLGGRHEQRNHVERPRPVNAFGIAVDVVGDAVVANRALRRSPTATPARAGRASRAIARRCRNAGGVRRPVRSTRRGRARYAPGTRPAAARASLVRNACDRFHQRGSVAFGAITLCRAGRLKSSVNGKSGLRSSGGTVAAAGVCPPPENRARRLLSAS